MNFLLHRSLAVRDLGDPLAGPRPNDAPELESVLVGIEHHLDVDRWFHGAAVFVDGERLAAERIRDTGLAAPKLALFGHIAWELCLDGALVRRDGLQPTLRALNAGFAAASRGPARSAADLHHFDRQGRPLADRDAFDDGMRQLFEAIGRGPWIAGYQDGAGVAQRIDGVRRRLGFPRLTADEQARFGEALEMLREHADAALAAIDADGHRRDGD